MWNVLGIFIGWMWNALVLIVVFCLFRGLVRSACAPQVVITSHRRSISQAFWGAEQAKDNEGGLKASTMQGTITRLETENARWLQYVYVETPVRRLYCCFVCCVCFVCLLFVFCFCYFRLFLWLRLSWIDFGMIFTSTHSTHPSKEKEDLSFPFRSTFKILCIVYTRKYLLRGYILGVLTHTIAWD